MTHLPALKSRHRCDTFNLTAYFEQQMTVRLQDCHLLYGVITSVLPLFGSVSRPAASGYSVPKSLCTGH
ncbi:hypothetical protein GBN67_14080 [Acinetobacter johnsonii]|nr:hypothetical protein GBN67_14080 [Acinetobacter johnsonii]